MHKAFGRYSIACTTSRRLFLFLHRILVGKLAAGQVLRSGGLLLVYNFSYRHI